MDGRSETRPLNVPIRLSNLIASLNALVERGTNAPTQAEVTEFNQLKAMASVDLGEWDRIKGADVAAFDTLISQSGAAGHRVAVTLGSAGLTKARPATALPRRVSRHRQRG